MDGLVVQDLSKSNLCHFRLSPTYYHGLSRLLDEPFELA